MIATHPHKDHIAGLIEVLRRYQVDVFVESGAVYSSPEYYELEKAIEQNGARRVIVRRPMRVSFFDGAALSLLVPLGDFAGATPKNIHDANIVGVLEFQKKKILLMGDAERKSENALLDNKIAQMADVLKVGHHGSKTSSTKSFLSVAQPKYSIISVGKNSYGHPYQITLDNLKSVGTRILRTDIDGTIIADIQNGALRIRQQK